MKNKGFTLIELIVVMAIIAVLVLLAAPRFLGYTKDANVTAMKQDTKVLSDASEMYYIDKNEWPTTGGEIIDHGIGGVDAIYPIDESKLGDSIKNIKGDYTDYGIAIDGKYAGQVFHLEGVEDKKGQPHYGQALVNAGIYTSFEIKEFLSQGYIPIGTADDLDKVRKNLNGKFIQVADINLSNISNFEPIGNDTTPFEGVYNGGGFNISNLTIDNNEADYVGLIGYASNSMIKNISLTDTLINGNKYVGGLIGGAFDDTVVSNIGGSGTINGTTHVGGLIGSLSHSRLIESYSLGTISGVTNVGGLIGIAKENSEIQTSYAKGYVSGKIHIGGLVGLSNGLVVVESYSTKETEGLSAVGGLIGKVDEYTKINKSYATGNVSGNSPYTYVGGLTGLAFNLHIVDSYATGNVKGDSQIGGLAGSVRLGSTVKNSYSTGKVSGDEVIGGLIGHSLETTSVNAFYDTDTSGLNTSSEGTGKTTTELQSKSTYTNWDFDTIWEANTGKYPTLKWQSD